MTEVKINAPQLPADLYRTTIGPFLIQTQPGRPLMFFVQAGPDQCIEIKLDPPIAMAIARSLEAAVNIMMAPVMMVAPQADGITPDDKGDIAEHAEREEDAGAIETQVLQ